MKKLASAALLLIGFIFVTGKASAQDYQQAIGIKLGTYSGISYKVNLDRETAIEGVFTFGQNTLGVTGSYQKYFPIREVQNLNWYAGGGGHLIFISGYNYMWNHHDDVDKRDNNIALGVNGVAGLDYKFVQIPLNIGIEAGPIVNLFDEFTFNAHIGIFARYTF